MKRGRVRGNYSLSITWCYDELTTSCVYCRMWTSRTSGNWYCKGHGCNQSVSAWKCSYWRNCLITECIIKLLYCRLAADIVPGRLESAKLVGADVTINCKEENLRDRGMVVEIVITTVYLNHCAQWWRRLVGMALDDCLKLLGQLLWSTTVSLC